MEIMTLENLPKEVITNILSRVPPETVFQFLSVNKFWNTLIRDPTNSSFLQHKHILFMRLQKDSDYRKTQLILSNFVLDPSMSLFNHFHLPLPFDWNQSPCSLSDDENPYPFDDDLDFYARFHIHDHSHGLVCLTDYDMNIILCNPTTKEFRRLPPSIVMLTHPSRYIFDGCACNGIGFGYDPKSRDFKVVRMVCFNEPDLYWQAEIFYLSTETWREVEVDHISNVVEVPSCGICHEGTLFWVIVTFVNESYIRTIHSFDLGEEVFGQIRLPKTLEEPGIEDDILSNWSKMDIRVLNGSLVIFHETILENNNPMEFESTLDIWKMEKNEESGVISWSKSFTIDLNSEIGNPFMFLSSNQLLTIKEGQISLYNVKSQRFKELPMKGQVDRPPNCHANVILKGHGCEATNYDRSLFSLGGEKY